MFPLFSVLRFGRSLRQVRDLLGRFALAMHTWWGIAGVANQAYGPCPVPPLSLPGSAQRPQKYIYIYIYIYTECVGCLVDSFVWLFGWLISRFLACVIACFVLVGPFCICASLSYVLVCCSSIELCCPVCEHRGHVWAVVYHVSVGRVPGGGARILITNFNHNFCERICHALDRWSCEVNVKFMCPALECMSCP